MTVLNLRADAEQAMDVMAGGGIAILPNDVGYSLIAAHRPALRRIFETKKRAPSKLNAMLGDDALHRELHVVSARGRAIVQAITQDYDLPLGLIAPCRTDHPLLRALDPLLAGMTAIASPLVWAVCRAGKNTPLSRAVLDRAGLALVRRHYYAVIVRMVAA